MATGSVPEFATATGSVPEFATAARSVPEFVVATCSVLELATTKGSELEFALTTGSVLEFAGASISALDPEELTTSTVLTETFEVDDSIGVLDARICPSSICDIWKSSSSRSSDSAPSSNSGASKPMNLKAKAESERSGVWFVQCNLTFECRECY